VGDVAARVLLREIALRARELEIAEAQRPGRQLTMLDRLPEARPIATWEPLTWEEYLGRISGAG
jgi:hypothetical protein